MPSIKLGQALSVVNQFLGSSKGLSATPKAAAVDLLKKSPLEMKTGEPTAHLVKNPLEFTNIQFPRDLGLGGGHYIIFYSISNNKSLDRDTKFNKEIGVSIDSEDIPDAAGMDHATQTKKKYNIRKLKKSRTGGEVEIGRPAPNSVLTGGLSTHSQVTGGVSLYMPPGIKASYKANNGTRWYRWCN